MRTSEVDILIVPGWSSSGPDHWQSRWERTLKTARRVEQDNWVTPDREAWVGRIIESTVQSTRPVVLVAHSLGVAAVAHLAGRIPKGFLSGAFLVAPADVDTASDWPESDGFRLDAAASGFAPLPLDPLPFPSVMVASSNDPYCKIDRATVLANAWGSTLVEAGDLGHINGESGHGPWPEGVLRFGSFLSSLSE
ncbi:MAG: serine hydrolase family protein [Hyphomicrobium zavarzinii]|uniref:RBBP9/YdeN family alpha/beta hydrolase n=1 Tax=Hyphomicrobium zavarzinii TaxID=48292 RepID=UPI001A5CA606|nr:alpha/beta hydrolase [Hyphomicrobium zavarzinii]MBL8845216.1 serine hydrolase family protein [Hyphomicrobium zavarzinii]